MRYLSFGPLALLCVVVVISLPNPNPRHVRPTSGPIRSLEFVPREHRFVSGSVAGEVALWSTEPGEPPQQLTQSTRPVSDLEFSPDGRWLAAAFDSEAVELIDFDRRSVVHRIRVPAVRVLVFSPDGRFLATGTYTGRVDIWSVDSGDHVSRLEGHNNIVTDIAFALSAEILATGSQDGRVRLWNWKSREPVYTFSEPHSTIHAVALPPDSTQILAVHFDQTVTAWDWRQGKRLWQRVGANHSLSAAIHAETGLVATVGRRGRLILHDHDGRLTTLQYFGADLPALAISHDATRLIAAGSGAGPQIAYWNLDQLRAPCGVTWIPPVYYVCIAVAVILAATDWWTALMHLILLDGFRDLARKLSLDEPRLMTVAVLLPWGAVLLAAIIRNRSQVRQLFYEHRSILFMWGAVIAAMIPAAAQSIFNIPQGASLAALGAVSYLAPLFGIVLGYLIASSPDSLLRSARFYAVVCCLFLSGALLEFARLDLRGLGGIHVDWIRYFSGSAISLISGFYRSPTVLGLHAGEAAVCGLLLAVRRPRHRPALWIAVTVYCLICLLLSGRRKMFMLPFGVVVLLGILALTRLSRTRWRLMLTFAVLLVLVLACAEFLPLQSLPHQLQYALTTLREAVLRLGKSGASVYATLTEAGPLGYGLGTVTQGQQYLTSHGLPIWQEDGISRVVAEMGLCGLVLLLTVIPIGAWKLTRVVAATPPEHRLTQMVLVGVTCGLVASYVDSHLTFSGDPSASILAACFLGCGLRLTHIPFTTESTSRRRGAGAASP